MGKLRHGKAKERARDQRVYSIRLLAAGPKSLPQQTTPGPCGSSPTERDTQAQKGDVT